MGSNFPGGPVAGTLYPNVWQDGGSSDLPLAARPGQPGGREPAQGHRWFSVLSSLAGEEVTHPGQFYDHNNYRQLPFVSCQKEVNEIFTTDLIAEQPVSEVRRQVVSRDRNEGVQGQPWCT